MPITKIIIENFKGIRDRVEIPIRPLTLLFGANSAGKTTVLHALLYLRELLERQNVDADRVIGGGKDIYLGGFRQLVHNHDEDKTVTIGVEFALDADGLEPYPVSELLSSLDARTSANHDLDEGIVGIRSVTVEVSVAISQISKAPTITSYRVSIDGELFGEVVGDREMEAVLDRLECNHPIFSAQFIDGTIDKDLQNPLSQMLEETLGGRFFDKNAPGYWARIGHRVIPKWGQAMELIVPDTTTSSGYAHLAFCRYLISQLMVRPGELILEHLKSYRHLGPIRAVPDLSTIAQRSPSLDRWIDGMAAWDLLSADAERQDDKRGQLISKLNTYLKDEDRLNLGYSLDVETVKDLPLDSALSRILERFIAAPDDFEGEAALRAAYAEAMARTTRSKLQLIDLRRNIPVNPSDIGAGVSQVIPVLVSMLDTASKVTAIEQPELHLHPAVQCSLGDLFVRAANKEDERFFFVETHSEHLLLRLMRRMRETQNSSLPSPDLKLEPDSITILFVETYEGRSIYREMPLNERGELVKAWPGGFFEEDMNELL
jgi:predicted ATPase